MISDKRLEKCVGKTVLIINKEHPFFHRIGTGKAYEALATGGHALLVKYDGGETGYVLSASELKIITDENKVLTTEDVIEQLAACNYGPRDIAMYLEMNVASFLKQWHDKKSAIRHHYEKGRLEADFDVNKKLFENAKTGNITAAQIFFKNTEARKVEDLKQHVFYGFET